MSWCFCLCFTYQQRECKQSVQGHIAFGQELGLLAPSSTDTLQCPAPCPLDAPPELRDGEKAGSWPWGPCPPPPQPQAMPPNLEAPPRFTSSLLLSPPWLPWSLAPVASAQRDPSPVGLDGEQQPALLKPCACRTPLLKPCSLGFLLGSRLHS